MKTLKLPGYIRPNGDLGLGPVSPQLLKTVALRAMKESDYRKLVKAAKEADTYRACYEQVIYHSF
jgi:hypothetical protein